MKLLAKAIAVGLTACAWLASGAADSEPAPADLAEFHELIRDRADHVYRDGKSHTWIGAGRSNEGRIDANKFAVKVNERSPRISRVNGGIGLDEILVFLNSHIPSVQSANDARGHRLADPIRVTNGEDEVANLQPV
jgi:hypothetical protein